MSNTEMTDNARVDLIKAICESLVNEPENWTYDGDVLCGDGTLHNLRSKTKIHVTDGLSPILVDEMKIFYPTAEPLAEAIHVWVAYAMRESAKALRSKVWI